MNSFPSDDGFYSDHSPRISLEESVVLTETERKCLEKQTPQELQRSKYDLPLEFFPNVYEGWLHRSFVSKSRQGFVRRRRPKSFDKHILAAKSSVMDLCERLKTNRVSRFQFVKEKRMQDALTERDNFSALYMMAIQLLRNTSLLKLQIIAENEICPSLDEIPFKLFSWSPEDHYKRIQIDNTEWLDAFEHDFKEYLEKMKFKYDMKEFCRYLDMILCGVLAEDIDYSFDNTVICPLEDANDLLSRFSSLKQEVEENQRYIVDMRYLYVQTLEANAAADEELRIDVMNQLGEVDIIYPLKYRYQKGWYDAQVDQEEFKIDQQVSSLKDTSLKFHKKTEIENHALTKTMTMYYTQIENFKLKNFEINEDFEQELERMDNEINYKKMSLAKLVQHRKMCEEQIQPMREKIVETRARRKWEKEEKARIEKEAAMAEYRKAIAAEEKKKKRELKAQMKKDKKRR